MAKIFNPTNKNIGRYSSAFSFSRQKFCGEYRQKNRPLQKPPCPTCSRGTLRLALRGAFFIRTENLTFSDLSAKPARRPTKSFSAKFRKKATSEQNVGRQEIGKLVLLAEARLGELFNQMPKTSGGDHGNQYTGGKLPLAGKFATESNDEAPKPKLESANEYFFDFTT